MFEFIKAVSDTVLDTINATYYDKPFIIIGTPVQKKLVSDYRAVNKFIELIAINFINTQT